MFVPDAIEAYTADQYSRGLAEVTVKQQGNYLRRFKGVCEEAARKRRKRNPLDVREIDTAVITAYFATAPEGLGQGARNNMLISLRKFLNWCEMERALPHGDAARLLRGRAVKKPTRQPKCYVPADKFRVLMDSATRHPADKIVMALALYTLARQSEIQGLRLKHVDVAGGNISMYRFKKKRWTDVGICPELNDELVEWLAWYADELGYGTAENLVEQQPEWRLVPRLVPDRRHPGEARWTGGMSYEMDPCSPMRHMERVIKRGLDATGAVTLSGKRVKHLGEGVHTIRRSGARAMLDYQSEIVGSDRALVKVATMLDHTDTQTTLLYVGLEQEREKLNDELRSGSMYGISKPDTTNVFRFQRRAG